MAVSNRAPKEQTSTGAFRRAGASGRQRQMSLRKAGLSEHTRRIDVQVLTDINNMIFKILATPDR